MNWTSPEEGMREIARKIRSVFPRAPLADIAAERNPVPFSANEIAAILAAYPEEPKEEHRCPTLIPQVGYFPAEEKECRHLDAIPSHDEKIPLACDRCRQWIDAREVLANLRAALKEATEAKERAEAERDRLQAEIRGKAPVPGENYK